MHSVLMGALGRQLLTDVSDSGKAQPWARLWAMSSAHLSLGGPLAVEHHNVRVVPGLLLEG